MTMLLQFGLGEEYVLWKIFRGFGLLQQYIYCLIFLMLLHDLMTSGLGVFLAYFNNLMCTTMTTRLVCFYCV